MLNTKNDPERLSGHDLVKYLIANPGSEGRFKWHTLRSCMWKNLLIECPQYAKFASAADFQKITHYDALKIIRAHWELTGRFPQNKFSDYEWPDLVMFCPGIIQCCDQDIHSIKTYSETDPFDGKKIKFKGGGGTSFQPVFQYLKDNPVELQILIYFTDGYGDIPEKPSFPVMWVITPDGQNRIPWGYVINMDK